MKQTRRRKQNLYGILILAFLLLLTSLPGQASGLQPILLKKVAAAQNTVVVKISAERLIDPVVKQFKEEIHSLLTKIGSPFACVRTVKSMDGALSTEMDWTDTLEKAIVEVFLDKLEDMESGDFTGFDRALGELLSQPNYQCLQDQGRFSITYPPANGSTEKKYEGWAYNEVIEMVRKVVPPVVLGLAPASNPNPAPGATPSAPASNPSNTTAGVPPSTPSAPTTPAAPPAPVAPANDTVTAEPLKDSQAPSATLTTLTEEPVAGPSSMASGGSCALSLSELPQGLTWSYLGYLFMLFPVSVIRAVKAKVLGGPKK